MPKYSVLIPVYKAEKTLQKCVDSFLNQTYENFELILVDDCSPDCSLELCAQFQEKDSRVVVLHQEQNKGVSAARNLGIQYANGDYILFADSDDFVTENYFDVLNRYAGMYDLVEFGHYDYITDEDGRELRIEKSTLCCKTKSGTESDWHDLFMNSFFASPWNKVYSNRLIGDLRFDESCVCYEDYLFNVHYCMKVKSFIVTEEPLYYYRQIPTVNHVAKRKWGVRFEISHKVTTATLKFLDLHKESGMQHFLCRYPYGAFITELKAAKLNPLEYEEVKNRLLSDKDFIYVMQKIRPKGKLVRLLLLSTRIKFYWISSILLDRLV